MKAPSLTLGVEEEYQIIDPKTGELRSYITEILKEDSVVLGEVKPELHQSMVEVGTRVCHHPSEVRAVSSPFTFSTKRFATLSPPRRASPAAAFPTRAVENPFFSSTNHLWGLSYFLRHVGFAANQLNLVS